MTQKADLVETDDVDANVTVLDASTEPETLAEARAATRAFAAGRRLGLSSYQEIAQARKDACVEYIELLSQLITTAATDPKRPELRAAYLQARERFHSLGGGGRRLHHVSPDTAG